ncbi:hypothetical protein [Paenibacillus lutrae]|uniref:hypothetical protein n=1 Tax=Paenibacillus lutrae TaxID=2078573 RepID=UPI0012F8C83E|nr:hypothetical protein [Paenibacillus lutrae]
MAEVNREELLRALIGRYEEQLEQVNDDNGKRHWNAELDKCEEELQRLLAG